MKTEMLIKVRSLFNSNMVPAHVNRHNQRQYIKSIRLLGDRYLVHKDNRVNRLNIQNEK